MKIDFAGALPGASRAPTSRALMSGLLILLAGVEGLLAFGLASELVAQWLGHDFWYGHYDFLAFYSAAHFMSLGRVTQIYDPALVSGFQHVLLNGVAPRHYMPFLNPPFAAVFLTPLALFSEPVARVVWFGFSSALAVPTLAWLTRPLAGRRRLLACAILLGTFPIYQTLIEGQWSLVMLLGCLAALHSARRGSYGTSGAFLSVLWLKPQIAVIVLAGLLLFRGWRMAAGMVATLLIVVLLTLPVTGLHAYLTYVPYLMRVFSDHFNGGAALHAVTWHGQLSLSEGLNGLFVSLFGQSSFAIVDTLSLLSIGATLLLYRQAVRNIRPALGSAANELMLVASIAVVLLINPHLYAQDITLLLLAVPILLPHLKNPLLALAGFCLIIDAPLLDQVVPLHLFTLCLWAVVILTCLAAANATTTYRPGASRLRDVRWLNHALNLA